MQIANLKKTKSNRDGIGRRLIHRIGSNQRKRSERRIRKYCVCPECGEKVAYPMEAPCIEMRCPLCGKLMQEKEPHLVLFQGS
jgi:hypothetical protein